MSRLRASPSSIGWSCRSRGQRRHRRSRPGRTRLRVVQRVCQVLPHDDAQCAAAAETHHDVSVQPSQIALVVARDLGAGGSHSQVSSADPTACPSSVARVALAAVPLRWTRRAHAVGLTGRRARGVGPDQPPRVGRCHRGAAGRAGSVGAARSGCDVPRRARFGPLVASRTALHPDTLLHGDVGARLGA